MITVTDHEYIFFSLNKFVLSSRLYQKTHVFQKIGKILYFIPFSNSAAKTECKNFFKPTLYPKLYW